MGDKIALAQIKAHQTVSPDAKLLLEGILRFFSNQKIEILDPPNWFANSATKVELPHVKHWSLIQDFGGGDIKLIWEPSRFHWLVLAAQAFCIDGNKEYLSLINRWLGDWSKNNPVNQGPNWKCGQETSIRLMNLLLAAYVLSEYEQPSSALVQLVRNHAERIYPTLHYAVAQDNNHGSSEMAALFIAGAWLIANGISDKTTRNWLQRGRDGLEERVARLVAKDGSFSQHSANYHRLFLDTLSLVEFWCLTLNQPAFSENYYSSAKSAVDWLWQMADPDTGDAPNLGANDGAMLLQLAGTSYRDFRPSVQLAGALFRGGRFYAHEGADAVLHWLGLPVEQSPLFDKKRISCLMDEGGYATFVGASCWGMLRFPRFRFRPSHADLMHLEIMDHGIPIFRDGGTFSYNADAQWLNYFPGVESHNTIQFDEGEPMPRLGRFLFGAWPEVEDVTFWEENGSVGWDGQYTDYRGCSHKRQVVLKGQG